MFLGFAVVNGLFRERVLEPNLGPEPAHFLATTTLAGFVFVATLLFVGLRSEVAAKTELLAVGILWAALTVFLELGLDLSHGLSGADLFRDYDFSRGRLLAWSSWRSFSPRRSQDSSATAADDGAPDQVAAPSSMHGDRQRNDRTAGATVGR